MKETSSVQQVNAPVEQVYGKIANLENLRPQLERLQNDPNIREKLKEQGHEDALDNLKDLQISEDSISFPAPMVGNIELSIVEREPMKCVKIQTVQSPISATIWIQTLPVTDLTSKLRLTVDADIPFMLKAMVGSKLKDGVEKLAQGLAVALSA